MNSDEIKIKAIMIFDAIGRPPEHLLEVLEKVVEDLGNEKGVEVVSKEVKEPVLMKDQNDFYTTFAEVEVDVEDVSQLSGIMFKYMPANIEIIAPEILMMENNRINEILNDLVIRLHKYDEIARVLQVEKQILFGKINELGGQIPPQVSPISPIYQSGQEQQVISKEPKKKKSDSKKRKKEKKVSSKKSIKK